MVSLIPVLELEPARYATQAHPSPSGSIREFPDEWHRYWRDSLADSGLEGLQPLSRGSWFVRLDTLTDQSVLRVLLSKELAEIEEGDEEQLGAFSGGFQLVCGEVSLEPGCCSDLGTLDEWREAAEHRNPEWRMVWIGHPWTHVRAVGDLLQLAEPSELDTPVGGVIEVERADLQAVVAAASEEVERFAARLTSVVAGLGLALSTEMVVDVLVRGHR